MPNLKLGRILTINVEDMVLEQILLIMGGTVSWNKKPEP
jgi:hypothetical protein